MRKFPFRVSVLAVPLMIAVSAPLNAQERMVQVTGAESESYADLADLVDSADLVLRARVRKQAEVEAERAPGLAAGQARLYVEADTLALLAGKVPVGESLRYLVDVPLDSRGRAPKLRKQEFLIFARTVAGRAGEIQLVDPSAQLPWSEGLEARLRPIMSEVFSPQVPPRIEGVRDALSVQGNLAGESETQIFLATEDGSPWSISVVNRPNMVPVWGTSRSEIVDQSAMPPRPETIEWYRLACSLPATLPPSANLASDPASRRRAAEDYAFVLLRLGPCERNRS